MADGPTAESLQLQIIGVNTKVDTALDSCSQLAIQLNAIIVALVSKGVITPKDIETAQLHLLERATSAQSVPEDDPVVSKPNREKLR